jgi:hypothetical protein
MDSGFPWTSLLLLSWMAGAGVLAVLFMLQHRRFLQRLGPLQACDGYLLASRDDVGPALLGVMRPQIIVPSDFLARFNPLQQDLVLAHEGVHRRRADPVCNLVCAALQCLFWFHPLVHLAATRFRADQELACDAEVLRKHPGARRSYAEAMLATQFSSAASALACHWPQRHSLKERIMQLQVPQPKKITRLVGSALLAAVFGLVGYAASAGQLDNTPDGKGGYLLNIHVQYKNLHYTPTVLVQPNQSARLTLTLPDQKTMEFYAKLTPEQDNQLGLATNVSVGDDKLAAPRILFHDGEPAAIHVNDEKTGLDLELHVSKNAQAPKN